MAVTIVEYEIDGDNAVAASLTNNFATQPDSGNQWLVMGGVYFADGTDDISITAPASTTQRITPGTGGNINMVAAEKSSSGSDGTASTVTKSGTNRSLGIFAANISGAVYDTTAGSAKDGPTSSVTSRTTTSSGNVTSDNSMAIHTTFMRRVGTYTYSFTNSTTELASIVAATSNQLSVHVGTKTVASGSPATTGFQMDTGTATNLVAGQIVYNPANAAPVLTAIGTQRAVKGRAKLINIVPTDADSNLTKIAYLCDENKGDWDCTLSGSASVTTGSKPSHTFEVTGTHAEIVATAATSTFTPTINTGSDTTAQITITDAGALTDSETFTVECYGARVYGTTQAGINATLATLGLTHDAAEDVELTMDAEDSVGNTDSDTSTVTFTANAAPTADAGPGQSVVVGQLVTLDGTGSSDPEDDTLTYQWTLIDEPTGSSVSLDDDTAAQPTFTPTHPGDYSFTLVVNDGTSDSAADGVTIDALAGNRVSDQIASTMKARRRNLVHRPLRNRFRWRT